MRKIGEIAIAAVEHLERWVQGRTGLVVITWAEAERAAYQAYRNQELEDGAKLDAEMIQRLRESRNYLADECRRVRRENYKLRDRNREQWGTINVLKEDMKKIGRAKVRAVKEREELEKLRGVVPDLRRRLKNAKRREKRRQLVAKKWERLYLEQIKRAGE